MNLNILEGTVVLRRYPRTVMAVSSMQTTSSILGLDIVCKYAALFIHVLVLCARILWIECLLMETRSSLRLLLSTYPPPSIFFTKDILHVMQILGHRNIQTTLVYTHLVSFEGNEFHSAVAETVEEAKKLVEAGFEYVCNHNDTMLFSKRK